MAILVAFLCVLIFAPVRAEEIPPPNFNNSFYILAIWDDMVSADESRVRAEFRDLKKEFGKGNRYFKIGFSHMFRHDAPHLEMECRVAAEERTHVGVMMPYQTHSMKWYASTVERDFRGYQWRLDGVHYKGTEGGGAREEGVPSPSRYSTRFRQRVERQVRSWARMVSSVMNKYPQCIGAINGVIEEELAKGGGTNDDLLADYSPFAVAEFRDWLRHRGLYTYGKKYGGEGAPSTLVGPYVRVDGRLRSPFYDDPTPASSNGTGPSFNQAFGTTFTTWDLRYWDLDRFRKRITDPKFDPTPEAGEGHIAGGFDAPRKRDDSAFWKAWSWDIQDRGGEYPPGNPIEPAFGFRQQLVHHYVIDLFRWLVEEGLPAELLFAHQIPGEILGGGTWGANRNRGGATPIYTGFVPSLNTVGITLFGPMNPKAVTQYGENWGIFEWHPAPGLQARDPRLYRRAMTDLNRFFRHKVHVLFPGWWKNDAHNDMFPLQQSAFARAIKDFLAARQEAPFHLGDVDPAELEPPRAFGLNAVSDGTTSIQLKWDPRMWEGLDYAWKGWKPFQHFEVQYRGETGDWKAKTTDLASVTVSEAVKIFRVRAVSRSGRKGAWANFAIPEAKGSPLLGAGDRRQPCDQNCPDVGGGAVAGQVD